MMLCPQDLEPVVDRSIVPINKFLCRTISTRVGNRIFIQISRWVSALITENPFSIGAFCDTLLVVVFVILASDGINSV